MSLRSWVGCLACVASAGALAACSSSVTHATSESGSTATTSSSTSSATSGNGGAANTSSSTGSTGGADAGTGGHASGDDAGDAAIDSGDGTPTRENCTSNFGNAVTSTHGRMDGLLVAIVPPENGPQCNADTGHVHLQIQVNGGIYDVAVNTDTLYDEIDLALPAPAWSEGWHPNLSLDYPTTLAVHSSGFKTSTATAIAQLVETSLAQVNHISVYATGYGPTGIHDVHRKGSGEDGAILIDPLSAKPHWLLFCFSTDSF